MKFLRIKRAPRFVNRALLSRGLCGRDGLFDQSGRLICRGYKVADIIVERIRNNSLHNHKANKRDDKNRNCRIDQNHAGLNVSFDLKLGFIEIPHLYPIPNTVSMYFTFVNSAIFFRNRWICMSIDLVSP